MQSNFRSEVLTTIAVLRSPSLFLVLHPVSMPSEEVPASFGFGGRICKGCSIRQRCGEDLDLHADTMYFAVAGVT